MPESDDVSTGKRAKGEGETILKCDLMIEVPPYDAERERAAHQRKLQRKARTLDLLIFPSYEDFCSKRYFFA